MIKYIGQHIFDFIARFRSDVYLGSDVYLEDIADGTVASDKFLGLDLNNKIVKETVSAGVTISDSTANTDFPVVFHDESNNLHDDTGSFTYNPSTGNLSVANLVGPTDGDLNIGSDGSIFLTLDKDADENNQMFTITESGDAGSLEYNAGKGALNIYSTTSTYPQINLYDQTDDALGSVFTFTKQRVDSSTQAGQDNDVIADIRYKSYNDNGTPELITYAQTQASIADASDSDEVGKYEIKVTTSDGLNSSLKNGLLIQGSSSADHVDVTLGVRASSTTTVNGGLVVNQGRSVNVASGSQKPIGMQVARRTITQAEANSMHSTPIELIPAQGANTIIEVMNVIARADRTATQTNSTLTMDVHYADKEPGTYGAASLAHFRRFMYNKTTDIVERRPINSTVSGVTLTEDVNKAVEVSFSAAATTNCFTSLDIYVTYFVIDIS